MACNGGRLIRGRRQPGFALLLRQPEFFPLLEQDPQLQVCVCERER
jgi:hypothetical protein